MSPADQADTFAIVMIVVSIICAIVIGNLK